MREKIMRAGHLEVALRRAKACAAGFFVASVGMHSSAAEAPWKFDPPKVGHALSEGGWSVGYEIGSVSASPEFTFPIQLVYLNGRTERGVFGGGWTCPQLDTRVIPRESGIFVWQMIDAATNEELEAYTYDKAGNMLEKTIHGEKTTMTYNAANELATRLPSSGRDGAPPPSVASPLTYRYDRAGRLLGPEGGPTSEYGWLDKVTHLKLPGGQTVAYAYWPDGQLASKEIQDHAKGAEDAKEGIILASSNSSRPLRPLRDNPSDETFLWDGLALLRRNDTVYLIEPHPSGGVPIASHPVGATGPVTYYLNDLLGTTLATIDGASTDFVKMTSFGQPLKAGGLKASPVPPPAPNIPSSPPQPPMANSSAGAN